VSTIEDLLVRLRDPYDLDGCAPAVKWLAAREGTLEQAWDDCPRGDWLLWLAHRVGVPSAAYIAASKAFASEAYAVGAVAADALRASAIAVRQHITGALLIALLDARAAEAAPRCATSSSAGARRVTTR